MKGIGARASTQDQLLENVLFQEIDPIFYEKRMEEARLNEEYNIYDLDFVTSLFYFP